MAINLQRAGEVNIPEGYVTEAMIADLAISTAKIKANAVTAAKADAEIKLHHLLTDDSEISNTGIVETLIKSYKFLKSNDKNKGLVPCRLAVQVLMKTSDVTMTGTMKVYVDNVLKMTFTTTSLTYELLSLDADILALTTGMHDVDVKLVNADATGVTSNTVLTSFLTI